MEDTLRALTKSFVQTFMLVLILVLMEDTLRGRIKKSSGRRSKVLILVLMEDTLRGKRFEVELVTAYLS